MIGRIPNNRERIWSRNSVRTSVKIEVMEGNYKVTNVHNNRYLMTGPIFLIVDLRLITCGVCGFSGMSQFRG